MPEGLLALLRDVDKAMQPVHEAGLPDYVQRAMLCRKLLQIAYETAYIVPSASDARSYKASTN